MHTKTSCRLFWRRSEQSPPLPALTEVYSQLESPSILGGNSAAAAGGRFSYWAAEPREIFAFGHGQEHPLEQLDALLGRYRLEGGGALPDGIFKGGWIGYFAYDLGHHIAGTAAKAIDDIGLPLIRLCFYDQFIAYDHIDSVFYLIALHLPEDAQTPNRKINRLEEMLSKARSTRGPIVRGEAIHHGAIDFSHIRCNMPREYFMRMFRKIRRHIYDGDVYQINFSQRFECDCDAAPVSLFHWENLHNSSPQAAYIDAGDFQIVSTSPELFVEIKDGLIRTKPIKGTRARVNAGLVGAEQAEAINGRNRAELIESEKEQAELNMIVDLERNDVARICLPGTRSVLQGRTIETFATVFHAVATVGGTLRAGITLSDVLRAMFPGGSITGAPKLRAMEIIEEIEPTARGLYTGSIGYIGVDGNASLNIAIRTAIIIRQKAFVQTGGGIVADSEPQAEWDETIIKARALLAGVYATQKRGRRIVAAAGRNPSIESDTTQKI